MMMAKKTAAVIQFYFNPSGRFLDFGGGDGMFVRHMRDIGYDFFWADKYATNIFAFGFEAAANERFDLVTSFEVFEHLPDPMSEISAMLERSENLLFSTRLHPSHAPLPQEWDYFSLHGGQHIAIYSLQTLQYLANNFNLKLQTDGSSIHLLSKKTLPWPIFSLLTKHKTASIVQAACRGRSLTDSDHKMLVGRLE
jgi:hypothetical protein